MIDTEDLKEMEAAFEEGKWDGMWTADLLAEVKRLHERIFQLEMSMEEYRQERPTEYCAGCYAYIEEYDGDGVKEVWCSDCEEAWE